jgi:hypothetical protein
MSHKWLLSLIVLLWSTALIGCNSILSSPEDRINAAIPVSEETATAKAALIEQAPPQLHKTIETDYKNRLKARALLCAKGYQPSWSASKDQIQKQFANRSCFVQADADIAKWLRLRQMGFILAKPPLRPLPASPPASIAGEESLRKVQVAENAGIAYLVMRKGVQGIELETGKPLFREATTSIYQQDGSLSPNGRLYTWGVDGRVKICDSETSAVITELPSRVQDFHWLDSRFAIYSLSESGKIILIDLTYGTEIPLAKIPGPVNRLLRLPGSDNQLVVISKRAVAKVEFSTGNQETEAKVIQEQAIRDENWMEAWGSDNSVITADGSRCLHFKRNILTITSLATLIQDRISFGSCNIESMLATADPDKILVSCLWQGRRSMYAKPISFLLYSIGSRTLAPIDESRLPSQQFLYLPPFKKLATISGSAITLLDELPLLPPLPTTGDPVDSLSGPFPGKQAVPDRKPAGYRGAREETSQSSAERSLADLPKNAEIKAIGIYQGNRKNPVAGKPRMGSVTVRMKRSAAPIVLLLSSYEPVQWTIIAEPGARLSRILLSGYNESVVAGAGSTRIDIVGRLYAYKEDSPQYNALNKEIYRLTGLLINQFHGRYEGDEFTVGE